MLINVVCENDGWIYGKFVEMFCKYSNHDILVNSRDQSDVTHYVPYYLVPKQPSYPCTSWQSHQESKEPLRSRFVSAARAVDVPLSHSKKYADMLKNEYGIESVQQIIPGIDLDSFKKRNTERPLNNKLVVGYVGRQYTSSNRKNPTLLKKISNLPFVDFRTTGGRMSDEDIPKFYAGLDITVSPATVEGGPMSVQESLSCGTPIMCFDDVGVTQEFSAGVIKVDKKDKKDDFLSRLEVMWRTKSYLHYRKSEIMNRMRKQVKRQSWKRFVKMHDKVWESLI